MVTAHNLTLTWNPQAQAVLHSQTPNAQRAHLLLPVSAPRLHRFSARPSRICSLAGLCPPFVTSILYLTVPPVNHPLANTPCLFHKAPLKDAFTCMGSSPTVCPTSQMPGHTETDPHVATRPPSFQTQKWPSFHLHVPNKVPFSCLTQELF